MYTDKIDLTMETTLDILYAANKYQIELLVTKCWVFLKKNISQDNVTVILDTALTYDYFLVRDTCINFMKDQVHQDIKCLSEHHVSKMTLEAILDDNELIFHEKDLFQYCCSWAKKECRSRGIDPSGQNKRKMLGPLLYKLRIANLSPKAVASLVTPSGLLISEEELSIFRYVCKAEKTIVPFVIGMREPGFHVTIKDTGYGGYTNVVLSDMPWMFCGLVCRSMQSQTRPQFSFKNSVYAQKTDGSNLIKLPENQRPTLINPWKLEIRIDNLQTIKVLKYNESRHEATVLPTLKYGPLRCYTFKELKPITYGSISDGLLFMRGVWQEGNGSTPVVNSAADAKK